MPQALDARSILQRRREAQAQRGYTGTGLIKELVSGMLAVDLDPGELDFDDTKMCVTGIISTESEDRSRDVVYTDGIDTSEHEQVPVVLYEHGLKDMLFPGIGMAQTPGGVYTVKKLSGYAIGTTYFHGRTKESGQCYDLARRGILKGLSLGFKPIKWQQGPIHGYDEHGEPQGGLLLYKTLLVEYTHCFLADNVECQVLLGETLAKNRANGEELSVVLYKSLSAHAPAKKHQANGATLPKPAPANAHELGNLIMKSMTPENKQRDPLTQGGYVDMDDQGAAPSPDQGPAGAGETGMDPDEAKLELPGAMALRELHDKAMDYKSCAEGHMNRQENPSIKAHLEKHCELGEQMMGEHAKLHTKEYQENPGFEELGSESPMSEDEQTSFAEDENGGSEMGSDPDAMKQKRLERYTAKKQAIEERNHKRLALAQKRTEARYFKKFLAQHDKKKLGERHHGMLTKALEFLDIAASKLPHEHFTADKGKENHAVFVKACSYHKKAIAEIMAGTAPDASAPADIVKTLTTERDTLKRKNCELLEQRSKDLRRIAQIDSIEKSLKATRRDLRAALAGEPIGV